MPAVNVIFSNTYDGQCDADFVVAWHCTAKEHRGYVPLSENSPVILMNNTLELVRESRGDTLLDASSFVVRMPSSDNGVVALIFYNHGNPKTVPKTEASELVQDGIAVQAKLHIFSQPLPHQCELVLQSTPKQQWQTRTYTDRHYKRIETFPSNARVDDRRCTIC